MHLMMAMGSWLSSPFALQCANAGLLPLKPGLKNPPDPLKLQQAVEQEARSRANKLLSGIVRYYDTPYARNMAEMPVIWRKGNARLLDYGSLTGSVTGDVPIMLFIPSLINRYYILDLEEERSLLRWLARTGVYPLVLDWGEPGEHERDFNCENYINDTLLDAVAFLHAAAGKPIALAGYCMGGVLALAAAQLRSQHVSALALLATPWDFHCAEFAPFVLDKQWRPLLTQAIEANNLLPADILQALFYWTDPFVFEHKFCRFADLSPGSRAAHEFLALEHWVNDGVPLTSGVAKECLIGWAQENQLYGGRWTVDGIKITPSKIAIPTFIAIPESDHVVPAGCALPLADVMPDATLTRPSSGHVGMIVGSRAKKELWQPLAEWVKQVS